VVRGGLVFEAHRLCLRLKDLLGSVTRVKKKKKECLLPWRLVLVLLELLERLGGLRLALLLKGNPRANRYLI